ncbi:hypothetical protein [Streptomyces sp. WAC 06725]|nr:hypothetical protein [Streptomyces sp. WAC 06725]
MADRVIGDVGQVLGGQAGHVDRHGRIGVSGLDLPLVSPGQTRYP